MMKLLVVLMMCVVLSSCALMGAKDSEHISSVVEFDSKQVLPPVKDPNARFSNVERFKTDKVSVKPPSSARLNKVEAFLRTAVVDGKKLRQLVVNVVYRGDWLYFENAVFEGGEKTDFVSLDRSVLTCGSPSCSFFESFAVTLDQTKFDAARKTGIAVRGLSKYIDRFVDIEVSPSMAESLLRLEDQSEAGLSVTVYKIVSENGIAGRYFVSDVTPSRGADQISMWCSSTRLLGRVWRSVSPAELRRVGKKEEQSGRNIMGSIATGYSVPGSIYLYSDGRVKRVVAGGDIPNNVHLVCKDTEENLKLY